MKFNQNFMRQVGRFQEGGSLPEDQVAAMAPEAEGSVPAEAPAEQGGVEEQVMQMAQQIAGQIGDPQIIGMLGEALIQIAQQAAQPQPAQFQRLGGKLVRIR